MQAASFDDLAGYGYDVQWIDDGAMAVETSEETLQGMPAEWRIPEKVITPKAVTLRNATLYFNGAALLPPHPAHGCDEIFFNGGWYFPDHLLNQYRVDYEGFHNRVTELMRGHTRRETVPGRCFSTRTVYSPGFAHFGHDVLTRIYYEDLGVITPGREKIIAPRYNFPIQKTLFEKVFADYEIVQASNEVALEVEELVIPANLHHVVGFNPKSIESLARRMQNIISPYTGTDKFKVCVSRSDGSGVRLGRDFVNYEAFEDLLRDSGYLIVAASTLDPNSQLELWANTKHIIGVHGSGMMNMIMMPQGGNYTEIFGASYKNKHGKEVYGNKMIMRCAIAAGHVVRVITSKRNKEDRPEINLVQVRNLLNIG